MKFTLFTAAALLLAIVSPAAAQSNRPRPDRPGRALFGGGQGSWEQSLLASGQIGTGYDDGVLPGQEGLSESPLPNVSAPYTQFAGGLTYSLRKGKANFDASGMASAAYYPSLDADIVPSYWTNVAGRFQLARRTALMLRQSLSYQPMYSLISAPPLQPDIIDPLDPELGARVIELPAGSTMDPYLTSDSSVNVSHQISRRVSLNGGASSTFASSSNTYPGYRSSMLNGGISWRIAKDLDLNFNYGNGNAHYRSYTDDTETTVRRQNINVGVNYQKALSISRRTHVGFWTGSTAISDDLGNGGETHFHIIGGVNLSREIGRTWGANLAYNRNVEFIETFLAPVQSDSVVASYGGTVNRRVQVQTFVGVSRGEVGFDAPNNGYYASYAGVNTSVAINSMLAIGGSYSYYLYQYDSGVALPPGYPSSFDRSSVRAQLMMNVPLFQRRGNSNVTR